MLKPFSRPFSFSLLTMEKNHCVGCGKQDHSVFFSGNIQDLKNSDIDEWIRSYSPNMTHIVREENTGYGLVHFKSCSEAGLFFREMYDTRFTGPFNTTKNSGAMSSSSMLKML